MVDPRIKVIEIFPKKDLGDLINGTLDFSQTSIINRINIGYYETMNALKPYMKEFLEYRFKSTSIQNKVNSIVNHDSHAIENKVRDAVRKIVK